MSAYITLTEPERIAELEQELAASQAREAVLRYAFVEVQEFLRRVTCWKEGIYTLREAQITIVEAIELPVDDTALHDALRKAKREALMEAATKCDEDYRYKVLSKHLRRMAEEN
jgi:hypothetical protein